MATLDDETARAVATLTNWLLHHARLGEGIPSIVDAGEALALLAESAHRTLETGFSGAEVREIWSHYWEIGAVAGNGTMDAAPAHMTPTVIAHVLWHFGERTYPAMEPGSFTADLIALILRADAANRRRLGAVYPAYVGAVAIARELDDGIDTLKGAHALLVGEEQS